MMKPTCPVEIEDIINKTDTGKDQTVYPNK